VITDIVFMWYFQVTDAEVRLMELQTEMHEKASNRLHRELHIVMF
jgi:hypothetical protein